MKKVMCFGTFDKLHPGHLSYLKQAKKHGDYLIVIVARDRNVLKIKKRDPKENEKERLKNIKKIDEVDKALLGEIKNKYNIVKKLKPDILCLGYDQRVNEDELRGAFKGKILRMRPYREDVYKSSFF